MIDCFSSLHWAGQLAEIKDIHRFTDPGLFIEVQQKGFASATTLHSSQNLAECLQVAWVLLVATSSAPRDKPGNESYSCKNMNVKRTVYSTHRHRQHDTQMPSKKNLFASDL
jgi:hypothetical protein